MNKIDLIHNQLRLKHAQEFLMHFLQGIDRNVNDITVYEFQQFIGESLEQICYNVEVNKNDIDDNVVHIQRWRWFM